MGKPKLVPAGLVNQHSQTCKKKMCSLCHWQKHKAKWKSCLQEPKWLKLAFQGKSVRAGCAACCLAKQCGPWGEFKVHPKSLKPYALNRHESSETHKAAIHAEAGTASIRLAPPAAEFQEALKSMRQGGSARNGGQMSDKKCRMRYALAESILARNRRLLATATCICIMRDERKGKLLLRFRAALADFTVVSGVLGLVKCTGSSECLLAATRAALSDFCIPMLNLPRGVRIEAGKKDRDLESHIRAKTAILVTDAAAPELLASQMMRGRRSNGENTQALFPQVCLVGKDAAHATTRLLSRPFDHHPEIMRLMENFVSGRESFSQKIHHSPVFQHWWREMIPGDAATSLCSAKQRFSSFLTPLSRISKNMRAMVQLCEKVATMRTDATWASKLLATFSGKQAISLAMITDAAAITMDLTRFADKEDMDVSQMNAQVEQFALSAEALFGNKKALTLPTFTSKVLEDFRKNGPLTVLLNGRARQISISQTDIDSAFKLMQDLLPLSLLFKFKLSIF